MTKATIHGSQVVLIYVLLLICLKTLKKKKIHFEMPEKQEDI